MATAKTKTSEGIRVYSRHDRQRVKTPVSDGNGAKQSFKNECDINQIMAKYQKTGAIDHFNKHSPEYGFATSDDFSASMRIVTKAQEMFSELPSKVRNKFDNEPYKFLDFVQDPANAGEMATLGLTTKKSESPDSDPSGAPEGDPKPSAEPSESPPPAG